MNADQAANKQPATKLERSKLLGFRNLGAAVSADKPTDKNAEIAFNKIGSEACLPL